VKDRIKRTYKLTQEQKDMVDAIAEKTPLDKSQIVGRAIELTFRLLVREKHPDDVLQGSMEGKPSMEDRSRDDDGGDEGGILGRFK
jgi:hypothetical protein